MKWIVLPFLCCVFQVVAQATVVLNDGSKVEATSVRIEDGHKRLAYFENEGADAKRIKFKALQSATWDGFVFRTFVVNKKVKGYYVIAETASKTLVSSHRIRVKNRGGFESTYVNYEIAVLDKQNNLLKSISFTDDSHSQKQILERAKVIPMINQYFSDCAPLLQKAALFESPSSDLQQSMILVFLNAPVQVACD